MDIGLHEELSVEYAPSLSSDSDADSSDDDAPLDYPSIHMDAADIYFLQNIVSHKMQHRIANKFRLLEHVLQHENQTSEGCAGPAAGVAQDEFPSSYDGYNMHGDMAVWLAIYRQHGPHGKQDRDQSGGRRARPADLRVQAVVKYKLFSLAPLAALLAEQDAVTARIAGWRVRSAHCKLQSYF